MDRKQWGMLLGVALIAGLVGGIVASWFLVGASASAHKAPQPARQAGHESCCRWWLESSLTPASSYARRCCFRFDKPGQPPTAIPAEKFRWAERTGSRFRDVNWAPTDWCRQQIQRNR